MKLEEAKMVFQKYFKDGPGKDFVMSVMDSIEIPESTHEEIPETDKPEEGTKPKRTLNLGKKICEMCGQEFYPNSGVQKLCLDCRRKREDIKSMARELAKS